MYESHPIHTPNATRSKTGVTGSISMNGVPSASRHYGHHCSYILQEDNLYANFTVQETMWLAASLKIADLSDADKQSTVDDGRNLMAN